MCEGSSCLPIYLVTEGNHWLLEQHVLWNKAGEAELEDAYECLERYVVTRLHTRIFAPGIVCPAVKRENLAC